MTIGRGINDIYDDQCKISLSCLNMLLGCDENHAGNSGYTQCRLRLRVQSHFKFQMHELAAVM